MDDWKKSNETSLPEKEYFYSHLNTEDITDADYLRTKKNYKGFEIKHLGWNHDFYVQSNTLLSLKTFKIGFLKYMNLALLDFLLH